MNRSRSCFAFCFVVVWILVSPPDLFAQTQADQNGSRSDVFDLGKFECVYLERVNAEKNWRPALDFLTSFAGQGDYLYLGCGGKVRGNTLDLNHRRLLALLALRKSDLVAIELGKLPNSVFSKSYRYEPLRSLLKAQIVRDGGEFQFFHAGKSQVKEKSLLVATCKSPSSQKGKSQGPQLPIDGVFELMGNRLKEVITPLDTTSDWCLLADESVVKLVSFKHQNRKPVLSVVTKDLGTNAQNSWRVSFPERERGKLHSLFPISQDQLGVRILTSKDSPESYLVGIDERKSKFEKIEGRSPEFELWVGEFGVRQHELTFYVEHGVTPNRVSFPSRNRILIADSSDFSIKDQILPPEKSLFGDELEQDRNGNLYVRMLQSSNGRAETLSDFDRHAIFRIKKGSNELEKVVEIPVALKQQRLNVVVDKDYLYWIAQLPKPLQNFEKGDRTGNSAIYRCRLPQ